MVGGVYVCALGEPVGSKLEVLGLLGVILVSSWRSWGHLGSKLGGLGAILAPTWEVLGPFWLQLGGSWSQLGGSWGQLGGSWSHFASKFGLKLATLCNFAESQKTYKNPWFFMVFGGFGGPS